MKTGLRKVPEVALLFWIIKILSTTVGETGADFLAENLNLGLVITSIVMAAVLLVALVVQFTLNRYVPASYWSVVVATSIVGTLITDLLVDDLGVSLVTITPLFTLAMIAVFGAWYASEKTLSIHSIKTPRREAFYWIIIFVAFALGTGVGDLLSEQMELGYGVTLLISTAVMAVVAVGYYQFKMSETLAFWVAFIFTRPLGASLGDLLIKPAEEGGMGFGLFGVNAVFLLTILGLIGYLTLSAVDKRTG